jgi:hypothetical protein
MPAFAPYLESSHGTAVFAVPAGPFAYFLNVGMAAGPSPGDTIFGGQLVARWYAP